MITYKQVKENRVQAYKNGQPTIYFIDKDSSFYQILAMFKGQLWEVRTCYSHTKEDIKWQLEEIIDQPVKRYGQNTVIPA